MRPSESVDFEASNVTFPPACVDSTVASGRTLLGVSVGRGASVAAGSSWAMASGIAGTSRAVPSAQAARTWRVLLMPPTLTHNLCPGGSTGGYTQTRRNRWHRRPRRPWRGPRGERRTRVPAHLGTHRNGARGVPPAGRAGGRHGRDGVGRRPRQQPDSEV